MVTRDVTGITDPVDASVPEVTEPTEPPEPLDYAIDWTQLSERVDEGTLTVPVDYADPHGDTIDLYVARHRAEGDERRRRAMLNNRAGPAPTARRWR